LFQFVLQEYSFGEPHSEREYAALFASAGGRILCFVRDVRQSLVATPIDLSSPGDQVFLCLFGTGFDAATANTTTATVAGQSAQVTYAGPQGEAALDQVNVLLPRSLAGSGDALLVLSVNGALANAVHVTIQ
jgi:uncharacterized protein (TIGR03437 family)